MKIDIYPHILPVKYKESLHKETGPGYWQEHHNSIPTLFNLDYRFRTMDKFNDLMQVLTIATPPVENIADPKKSVDLAKLANDEMAELVLKYPDRFTTAAACLPMNNMDAALKEVDRAINDLNFRGVQIFTPINDKPLDTPEFIPLYEKMCQHDLPIWIHPQRDTGYPDYRSEETSKYSINSMLGWVYETSTAMVRLVLSGILARYPNLKLITHHSGAMIPFLEKRIARITTNVSQTLRGERCREYLRRPTIDYFKMFYTDTAINGHTAGLMCSYSFFGARRILFGTDMPFDNQFGITFTRETIESVERMTISDSEKKMLFAENARNLLRLAI